MRQGRDRSRWQAAGRGHCTRRSEAASETSAIGQTCCANAALRDRLRRVPVA